MIFSLEVLKAKHGDCLLLHSGHEAQPNLVLIDGGPRGTYRRVLKHRLEQLRAARAHEADPLPIDLVVVSHNDEAHLGGILEMVDEMAELQEQSDPPSLNLGEVWHNSFDDLAGTYAQELVDSARVEVGAASLGAELSMAGLSFGTSQVLASVAQDRSLRAACRRAGLTIPALPITSTEPGRRYLRSGLRLTVLSPTRSSILDQQGEWDRVVKGSRKEVAAGLVSAAALADQSVYRVSSLVLLAEAEDRTMLLTSDARSDDILIGLEQAGLLTENRCHFDVLKVPAHGSGSNVDADFFDRVTADHYVISADGRYGNPDPATLASIRASRRGEAFRLHLTYAPEELSEFYPLHHLRAELEALERGSKAEVVYPEDGAISLVIDLLSPLQDRTAESSSIRGRSSRSRRTRSKTCEAGPPRRAGRRGDIEQ